MALSPAHLKAAAHHVDYEPLAMMAAAVLTSGISSVSMHYWANYVDDLSKLLHFATQLGAGVLIIVAFVKMTRGSTVANDKQMAEVSRWAPGILKVVFSAIAVFAVAGFFRSRTVNVSEPMGLVSTKRKLSDDHAGDDGEVEGTTGEAPLWLAAGYKCLGWHERLPNGKPNPAVSEFFGAAGASPKTDCIKFPWCAAFVNAMLEAAGVPGTRSAMARSFLKWGTPCEARRGAVVVFWRGNSDDGVSGHVGFVDSIDADGTINVLGGNQRDKVCVAKFSGDRVLGFRWPRSMWRTKTVQGAGLSLAGVSGMAASDVIPSSDTVADTLEKSQSILEQLQTVVHGKYAAYIRIGLIALAVVGALYAIYGRADIRKQTGY